MKAHAYTMGAMVMLFLFPFAIFGIFLGGSSGFVFGVGAQLLHAFLISRAVHHWRTEKKRSAIFFRPDGGGVVD